MSAAVPVYLDHNATTPIAATVVDAMLPYLREHFGNPSSAHPYGQRARAAVERAREQVAQLLGAEPDEILFTSGGTEANNLAIRGVAAVDSPRCEIVTSAVEHPATARPCSHLAARGFRVRVAPVDGAGRVDVEAIASLVGGQTRLVTLMLAQNETGTLMPVAEVAALARAQGALIHTDAAQAVGKLPTRVHELGVDLLSIAGHKLYAPKGVGALFVRRHVELRPVLLGAGHERGLRPGTENVAAIVGLGRAAELAASDLEREATRVCGLRDELWRRLHEGVPGVRLNGHISARLPNTLNLSFPGVSGNALLAAAAELAASTGSACHAGGEAPSPVLLAMGLAPEVALGAVRLSLGRGTTAADVVTAAAALTRAFAAVSQG